MVERDLSSWLLLRDGVQENSSRTRRLEGDKRACTPALNCHDRTQRHMQKRSATIFEDTHECTLKEKVDNCEQRPATKRFGGAMISFLNFVLTISFHFVMLTFLPTKPWPISVRNATNYAAGRPCYHVPCYSNSRPEDPPGTMPCVSPCRRISCSNYDATLQSPKREEEKEEGIRHAVFAQWSSHPAIHPSIRRKQSETM